MKNNLQDNQSEDKVSSETNAANVAQTAELDQSPGPKMTYGKKLVGLSFNPSNDDKVAKAKKLFANAADLINDYMQTQEQTDLSRQLANHTIGEILNAQMCVVKVLTLKY